MNRNIMLNRRTFLKGSLYLFLLTGCSPITQNLEIATSTATAKPDSTLLSSPTEPTSTEQTPTLTLSPTTDKSIYFASSPIIAVSSSPGHYMALQSDGRVLVWGDGRSFALPDEEIVTPIILDYLEDIQGIFPDRYGSWFIQDGKLIQANVFRDGRTSVLEGIDQVTKVVSDSQSVLALRSDGTLWGYGLNSNGQLGNGSFDKADQFTLMELEGVIDVTLFFDRAVAVLEDGSVWQWGDIYFGELEPISKPQLIPELTDVRDISFITGLASVHMNGSVSVRRFSDIHSDPTIIPLSGLPPIVRVERNTDTSYGLLLADNGDVWGWGYAWSALGFGPTPEPPSFDIFVPKKALISDVIDLSCRGIPLALDKQGTVWKWGGWIEGDVLGDGEVIVRKEPTPFPIIQSG